MTMLSPSRLLPSPLRRLIAAGALSAGATASLGLAVPGAASASTHQIAMIQDGQLQANPAGTLAEMRSLGATTVRAFLYWDSVAPRSNARRRPRFNATNPNAYPARNWAPYDAIVRAARADGMRIDFVIAGGSPRWASGNGAPVNNKYFSWRPNAGDYGQFVQAVGKRYDGSFRPQRQRSKLPRVNFWTIWNEPNFGEDLGPQATDTSRISYAPMMYRNLVRSGWSALRRTGHRPGRDTILIGELAAHGTALSEGRHGRGWPQGLPGDYGQTQPLPFIRTLYCLDGRGAKLTGTAAHQVGCPTTAAGRRAFRRHNPGLFGAAGVGDHPYANSGTPASDGKGNPNWSTFPNLPRLERTLDQANRAYGSRGRLPIYSDEYGYVTDPPQKGRGQAVPQRTAARYINWAEYLSWRSPRVASYSQYLLQDGSPNPLNGNGGFASGLLSSTGKPKPTLNAYRMPLWVPYTNLRHAGRDQVWGEARPAHWTGRDSKRVQTVQVQFQAHGKGRWKTVWRVRSNTYFDVRPRFTTSGDVRLRYSYPKTSDPFMPPGTAGRTIVSRTQSITVR